MSSGICYWKCDMTSDARSVAMTERAGSAAAAVWNNALWSNLRKIYRSALGNFKPAVEIGWTLIENMRR